MQNIELIQNVELIEVGPRDGLQNEPVALSTMDKVELIECCISAGLRRIEAVSFAYPGRVPQLADPEEVMASVPRVPGISYAGLVLDRIGLQRALAAGVDEVNVVIAATEEFSQYSQDMGVADALHNWGEIAEAAVNAGVRATATIAAAFGCPFASEVSVDDVAKIAQQIGDVSADEIVLADTIGVGTPDQVRQLVAAVSAVAPDTPLRFHFHNTRNTGYANAIAAIEAGVSRLDTSIGGIGRCQFVAGATGNIATEDLLYALDRMGIDTGVDIDAVIETSSWLAERLGRPVPALLGKAGTFPLTT